MLCVLRFSELFRCAGGLPDLQHTRSLNDWRLPLAIGKFDGLGAVRIDAGEPFAIFVKYGHLPVLMFAPLVFPELRTLSCCFRPRHKNTTISIGKSPRKYRFRQYFVGNKKII